jgi:hypothetical protein
MNASLPPTDADIAKATLQREEQQRLAMRERLFLWRGAVVDCLSQAIAYAQMAQLAKRAAETRNHFFGFLADYKNSFHEESLDRDSSGRATRI